MQNETDIMECKRVTSLCGQRIELPLEGYHQYWNYAEKKGYSGTALFTKKEPLQVTYGIGIEEYDREGRVITAEYEDLYVVTVYTPNSQQELARLSYRMTWEKAFLDYINGLKQINDAFVEDIAHKNKMILDKGKRQFKKLTKM